MQAVADPVVFGTDLLLVNRNGVDYKATVAEVNPSVCDLEELPVPPPPWEGADGIYHVIITDPAAINVTNSEKIYNKDTGAEVSKIDAAGEWIITGLNVKFKESTGTWEFGDLTDTSKVTDMSNMFSMAHLFNGDISGWNTSSVTTMHHMFYGTKAFNIDISGWDISSVKSMSSMFRGTDSFNQDISGWNTSNVTDMSYMFSVSKAFNIDISSWDTENVETMRSMFRNAVAFNQDISAWNTSSVTEMGYMFHALNVFDQDLSGWCVTNIPDKPDNFDFEAGFEGQADKQPQWGTCP